MDYYLRVEKQTPSFDGQQVLSSYLKKATSLDPEYQFGYELVTPRNAENKPYWRTYLLHTQTEISAKHIKRASVYWDATTSEPAVLVEFSEA